MRQNVSFPRQLRAQILDLWYCQVRHDATRADAESQRKVYAQSSSRAEFLVGQAAAVKSENGAATESRSFATPGSGSCPEGQLSNLKEQRSLTILSIYIVS